MKFLVDRCAGRRLAEWLRKQGHDAAESAERGEDPGDPRDSGLGGRPSSAFSSPWIKTSESSSSRIGRHPSALSGYDFESKSFSRLTTNPAEDFTPAWTPDGRRVAFGSSREGPHTIFWKDVGGTGRVERLVPSAMTRSPNSWSPDGKTLRLHIVLLYAIIAA